jgi:putative tryptophan/tyrosine transport system substrate-binding protein
MLIGESRMQLARLRRRDVIALAGAAAAWPFAARAQQPTLPLIGLLDPTTPDAATADRLRSFRQGLKEAGFVEGESVTIEYRWAESRIDRLSMLAAEFVRRRVAVIVAIGGSSPAFAAKAETSTIPIVFTSAQDPVKLGLVTNLAKPGGNLTGVVLPAEPTVRRLDLLRELVPSAARISVLLDPANASDTASIMKELDAAAARMRGVQIKVVNAGTAREIDAVFTGFGREPPDALLVGPFSTDRRVQLALLTMLHKIPTAYPWRDFADVGGLMSYGPNLREAYRQAGVYVGRILKGAKPADLRIIPSTKYELVINALTARLLELPVPRTLLPLADEVIE